MKKIISIFLIVVLIASFPVMTFAESSHKDFLSELGLSFDGINEDMTVTRGAFTSLVAKLFYDDITPSGEAVTPYTDVSVNHPYFNGIYTLTKLGIISGSNNEFRPDEGITFQEASVIILKASGYDLIANANGGYPSGYMYTATLNGLFKNIEVTEGELKGKDAQNLLYNSLFMEAIELSKIEDGEPVYEKTGKIILTSKFDVVKYEGVVTNDGFMSFDNSGVNENGMITLKLNNGNNITMYSKNDFSELFGKNSVVYAKYNKDSEIYEAIYGAVSEKVSVETVKSGDIIRKTTSSVEYEYDKENGKSKTLKFNAPYVFVNGKKITSFNSSMLKPANGFIELIDNNNDKSYDVLLIWNFEFTDVVDRAEETVIAFRKNPSNNLELDNDKKAYRYIKDGETATVSDITKDSVLSVSKAAFGSEELYFVFISNNKVSGTVVSVEGKEKITIETLTYNISPILASDNRFFAKAKIGESATFYVDCLGDIVYCDSNAGGDVNYFYILNLKTESSVESEIRLYAYTRNAVFADYVISEKNLVVDGERLDGKLKDGSPATRYNELRELLCTRPDGSIEYPTAAQYELYGKTLTNVIPRPAIYKVNSKNEIIYIDTDAVTHSDESIEAGDSYALKPGIRYYKDALYNDRSKTMNGRFYIGDSTLILKVADIDRYNLPSNTNNNFIKLYEEELSDINNYYVYSSGELTRNMALDIQAYNIEPETGIADLVVIRGAVERNYSNSDYRNAICIFDYMTEYYDSDLDKSIYKIYYYNYGSKESVKVDPEQLPDLCNNIVFGGTYPSKDGTLLTVKPLKQGDAIYINVSGGYLTHIHRDLDIARINEKSVSTYHSTGAYNPYFATSTAAGVFDIPFDQRDIYQTHDYASTYIMDLALAYSMSGNTLVIKKPAASGASLSGNIGYTSLKDYINSNGSGELVSKYINHSTAGITVVEEVSHNPSGNCEFRMRSGSLADINFMSGYSKEEGFYKASRIFTYDEQSSVYGIIIYNLKEEHNHVQ